MVNYPRAQIPDIQIIKIWTSIKWTYRCFRGYPKIPIPISAKRRKTYRLRTMWRFFLFSLFSLEICLFLFFLRRGGLKFHTKSEFKKGLSIGPNLVLVWESVAAITFRKSQISILLSENRRANQVRISSFVIFAVEVLRFRLFLLFWITIVFVFKR